MSYRFAAVLLLLLPLQLKAQYYDMGQDPGNLSWMQIETERFKVIYPEIYDKEAVTFLNELENAYSLMKGAYPEVKVKIPVVIHNYSSYSNGTVVWAPKRMEVFPTPEQNGMPIDNLRQLAIHELSHVFQMSALERNFTKIGKFLVGEQFPGLVAATLPSWYLEGQAVFNESYYTESGRGRSASFMKQLKAISIDKGMYKYDKLRLGSYKDFVPNHYYTGYQVVSSVNLNYGDEVWNQMLDYTSKYPYTVSPSHFSIKKNTGFSKQQLFENTFIDLNDKWKQELHNNEVVDYNTLNINDKEEYKSYQSPVLVGGNSIAAVKTSLSRTPEIVLINSNDSSEEVIHVLGNIYPYFLSSSGSKLVWVETVRDPRWEHRSYSIIKMFDAETREVKKLSSKSRYMSAAISPDGKTIAAVENSVDNINKLVFIDAIAGNVILAVSTPDNIFLQRPQWSSEGNKVTSIYLSGEGEGVISYSYTGNSGWEYNLEANRDDYQTAFLRGDTLFYVSSVSGTENGYAKLPGGKHVQLTNSRFGATDLITDGSSIWFSNYSISGNDICRAPLNTASIFPVASKESYLIEAISHDNEIGESGASVNVDPKPYNKFANQFNVHSWFPLYVDVEEVTSDFRSIRPGVTLLSQNLLSTVISSVSYEYSNSQHILHGDITWQGKYPVLWTRVNYGLNDMGANSGLSISSKLSVPLLFNEGKYYQKVTPSITVNYYSNYFLGDKLVSDGLLQAGFRSYFYNYHRLAVRDIYPRFGQYVDLLYSLFPFENESFSGMLTLKTAFYFPGGLPNSGIRLRYETDYQKVKQYLSANRSRSPRGYHEGHNKSIHYLSIDYAIPVAYPDWSLSCLLYLKRIRVNLFYDNAIVNNDTYLNSKGVEIMADMNLLRIPYEVSSGIRLSLVKEYPTPQLEVIYSMNIFGNQIGKQTSF